MSASEPAKPVPAVLASDFSSPSTIAERFIPISLIGFGPRGAAYRAEDRMTGELVALKLMRSGCGLGTSFDCGLAPAVGGRELAVIAVGESAELSFVVTALAAESPLSHLFSVPFEANAAMVLVTGLATALADVHRGGRIHGNLKPSNVFGAGAELLLADSLPILGATRHGRSLEGMFTRLHLYMAPEVAGLALPGPAADVFAVGVIAIEAMTGRHPFADGDVATFTSRLLRGRARIPKACPKALRAALRAALDPDPRRRPADGSELLAALTSAGPRPWPRRALIAAVTVAVVAAAASVIIVGKDSTTESETIPVGGSASPAAARIAAGSTPVPESVLSDSPSNAPIPGGDSAPAHAERGRLRREVNRALTAGDDSLALRKLRELDRLDPADPTTEWRIREIEERLEALSTRVVPGSEAVDLTESVRSALGRGDHVMAARSLVAALAGGVKGDQSIAGATFFNASVTLTRLGNCAEAREFADRASQFDDPERAMSNRRWRDQLAGVADCTDPHLQVVAESLALK